MKCEQEKEETRKVNVTGTLELIRQLADKGIKPVFLSSDYVFDGEKGGYPDDAKVNPITEYGRQKAEVEGKIGEITKGDYLVVRLSKVFSLNKGDGTLLDEMAEILFKGGSVKAAYDQIFCPTYIMDVVGAVSLLQKKKVTGVVNLCSPESWARYDLAAALAGAMGKEKEKIIRISLDEISNGIKRPKNTSLTIKRLKEERVADFMTMKDCIKEVADNWRDK